MIREALRRLRAEFEQSGIDTPDADAELLVAHVLGESRGRIAVLAALDTELTAEQSQKILALADLRNSRVPLQHLTGRAAFRNLELSVGPGVFIPRPETETVAQFAIDSVSQMSNPIVFDLCTGSGALALAIATEVPTARVWAWEKSPDAHAWAHRNITQHGDGRVQLRLGDITELLTEKPEGQPERVDLLASNPPYVPSGMIPKDAEVRDHDPALALYSGEDGLDLIRTISLIGRKYVRPGGSIVLEHAEGQGAAIRTILSRDGWEAATTHKDLTRRDRCTVAVSPLHTRED